METPIFCNMWERTAREAPPACESLFGEIACDVAVVGAGVTGLSAALRLCEGGADAVVLDAAFPAAGASGRSGGQIQPISGYGLARMLRGLSPDQADRVRAMALTSPDLVFDLIDRHSIDCDAVRTGLLRGIHHERLLPLPGHEPAADAGLEFLDREQTARMVGSGMFHASYFDCRGGGVNPCAYTRGLCRAARSAGVRVFSKSPALELRSDNSSWIVRTPQGTVKARNVVVATNAFSHGLVEALEQTIVTVNSIQIATYPLSGKLAASILPGGQIASDTRRLVYYFRKDAEGRLVVGGRGPASDVGNFGHYGFLVAWMQKNFPFMAPPRIQYYWSGEVAITADGLPHVHEPARGLHIVAGFNGKGMAMGTRLGTSTAERILHDDPARYGFAVRGMRPYPFWRFRKAGVRLAVSAYRVLDKFGR